jgi:DNA-binding NarL/FixJ family response regulator
MRDRGTKGLVRLAIVNDYEIVVRGLASVLEERDGFRIVELATGSVVDTPVDLALYDTFGAVEPGFETVRQMVDDPHVGRVVVFTWVFETPRVDDLLAMGVDGYLSKALSADDLVDALHRIHGGERVVSEAPSASAGTGTGRRWPGQSMNLTEKEADVLAFIVRGLDNREIAELLYISPNTLKTRIRSLYRKLGVESRVQAALWGVQHGFQPDSELEWDEIRWGG